MGDILAVRDLKVEFRTARGPAHAVAGVSFSLVAGERLGLVGESGSGKSTTILALLRMIKPPGRIAAGHVTLDGEDLLALSPEDMRRARFDRIALVPQGAMSSLNPVLRIRDQIEDVMRAHGRRLSRAALDVEIATLFARVGLAPSVAHQFPHELSGGMKQRVCIAMAICLKPRVIIADEPTSALDVIVQKQVLDTLRQVQTELGAAVILVGHDMGLMAQFADRIGVMYAGRIVEIAPVRNIFRDPRHPYTRMLIASLPSLDRRGEFHGIPGIAPSLLNQPPGCPFHPRCPRATERCARERPELRQIAPDQLAACHYADEVPA